MMIRSVNTVNGTDRVLSASRIVFSIARWSEDPGERRDVSATHGRRIRFGHKPSSGGAQCPWQQAAPQPCPAAGQAAVAGQASQALPAAVAVRAAKVESCFTGSAAPHFAQAVGTSARVRDKCSNTCPQEAHWYS
jgi:hypothetical protein